MWAKILLVLMALFAQMAVVEGFEAPLETGCPAGSTMDSSKGV